MNYFATISLFIKVVEHGSFSGGAFAAGVKTSSASRAIAALEKDLGVAVFRRTTRSMELTDAGLAFYKSSVKILADLAEARRTTTSLGATTGGKLRIRAPVDFGRRHVAPLVNDLLSELPGVAVDLVLTDEPTLVMTGFDVGVWIGKLPDARFIARRLGRERYVVCASPRYLESAGRPAWPAELSNFDCLTLEEGERNWTFAAARSSVVEEVTVFGRIKSNQREALMSAAVAGAGIVRLPVWMCGHHLRTGELVALLGEFDTTPEDSVIHAVHTERLAVAPRIGVLMQLLERATGALDLPRDA